MTPDSHSIVERIIAELEADPQARTLLLRALLTEEFLNMPVRLERVEADVSELKATTGRLVADMAEVKADVSELKATTSRLEADVSELKATTSRLEASMGNIEGRDLELRLHKSVMSLASKAFRLRRPEMMQSRAQGTEPELQDAIGDAHQDGLISDREEQRLSNTDIILRARRREENTTVWLAIEVSRTVRTGDIERARQSAGILGKILGEETVAVTTGGSIRPEDLERAEAAGVTFLSTPE